MDLLSALHSFVRVAATGSFSAVSRETGVSQPTISRHIALLESHYGTTLFARTTRSLTMTEDGRSLLPHAYEVLEILETAETVLGRRRASVSGLVRLGVTTAFGLCLSRRLGELLDRHPDLSVEIVMRDAFGDLVEEGWTLRCAWAKSLWVRLLRASWAWCVNVWWHRLTAWRATTCPNTRGS